MHRERVRGEGVDVDGVRRVAPTHGVHPLRVVHFRTHVREGIGQITDHRFSRVIDQLNVKGGVVQGLLQHKLQHVLKRHRVGRIVEVANAPKSFGHVFLYAHADDKGLHHDAFGLQGPRHDDLGIAMDMSIGMKVPSGAICSLSLSFNNDGPLGAYFRYICDNGTYIARYDDLYDGKDEVVDLSGVAISNNGIELIDREFLSSISEGREPNGSVKQCLPAMHTMARIEESFQS